jgi:hypothetical protein
MRKIILSQHIDPESFQPSINIILKTDEQVELLASHAIELGNTYPRPKYTQVEQTKIDLCNSALQEKGYNAMTEKEIESMLYPMGRVKDVTPEEIQVLSGFTVEKVIRYNT